MPKSDQQKASFLPYHVINEFMRDDFRLKVVRSVLADLPNRPRNSRVAIDRLTRRHVQVPGFRNSVKAPASVKARPLAKAFEKHPDLVAAVLSAWAETKPDLRRQVFDLLEERGWECLPPEADRTKLPGFTTRWPEGDDFETINQAFADRYPETDGERDDVSLMVVWLSGRLPVEKGPDASPSDASSPGENETP